MNELENKLFSQSWNHGNRENILKRLQEIKYDVIIIGGSITGAGVAREATMRRLKVALVEMQDFVGGTSSRSSKMAHSGLRYLSYGDFDLVKESTTERN